MIGHPYPSPKHRVGRFGEMVRVITLLLRGEVVTYHGEYVHVDDAFLLAPQPVQPKIPLLVGGNGTRLLRETGGAADIVSLSGLGRTLQDGHRHAADWSAAAIDDASPSFAKLHRNRQTSYSTRWSSTSRSPIAETKPRNGPPVWRPA